MRMRNGTTAVENSMVIPPKIPSTVAIWSSNSTAGCTFERIESRVPKR